jgi:hypothetical protein
MPLKEGNYLTLYYRITPAAYSGAATPEILPLFDHILCNGAELALKEWLREPDRVINMWQLFEANLMSDIQRYNEFNAGQRRRTHLKIHKSYRVY